MAAGSHIQCRVSAETKANLAATARRLQISESAFIRRLVEMTIRGADSEKSASFLKAPAAPRSARLYVRLRPGDRSVLTDRAGARGLPAASYASLLIRAHLRNVAPVPREELVALKRCIGELSLMSRNLRQAINDPIPKSSVHCPSIGDLKAMLGISIALRDHVKGVLLANLKSWAVSDG
jgi:hypothetical protein